MAKIKKIGTLFMNTSNPSNMHLLDINASIDIYNTLSNLENLLALQKKVKGYEFSKLSTATAIELNEQIDRELEEIKKAHDLESVARFLAATVNCRAGGRVLQISGGGGDLNQEGGGYAAWKEYGFENVCQLDAYHAMKFEEVAYELAQEVTANTLSKPLTAFLTQPSTMEFKTEGVNHTFASWVRQFRGSGICVQKTSSDGKGWLLGIIKDIPHFKQLSARYALELDNATRKGEKEFTAYNSEKIRRREAAAKNSLGSLKMPENWQMECFNYGDHSGNWVLQEFVRINKHKPLPVVSKQYPQVIKTVDDYLLPQLAGSNWKNAKTPDFKKAWDDKDKTNQFAS